MKCSRRKFITGVAAVGVATPLFARSFGVDFSNLQKNRFPISFFTKPLDGFELAFMAETLAMAGLDGIDLTVRSEGRVEPERITNDLPKVIEMGRKFKLSTEMMVTDIIDANDPASEKILSTASKYGIKHYRMGYFDYDFNEGIWESLGKIKNKLAQLAILNKTYDIQSGYQNHTGIKVGAPVWDVWELVRNFPVEFVSSQFDIRHAVTEGSASWVLGTRLLSKNIGSLAIKDFTWQITNGVAEVVSVPLGQGLVDFNSYFKLIKELNISAPITLHVEYPFLSKEEESFPLLKKQKIIVAKLKNDVAFISHYLRKFQMI